MAGLASARARGRKGGRRPILDEKRRLVLRSLAQDPANSPAIICATLGISRATFYRYAGPAQAGRTVPSATAARPAAKRAAGARNRLAKAATPRRRAVR